MAEHGIPRFTTVTTHGSGATLQSCNNDLVMCLEELRAQKEELVAKQLQEQEVKAGLEHEIKALSEKLVQVTDSLNKKTARIQDLDSTIEETEFAYKKLIDNAGSLVALLKRETSSVSMELAKEQ